MTPVPPGTPDIRVLERVYATILEKRAAHPDASYTARLFHRGIPKIAQKVGEEAVEAAIEAVRHQGGAEDAHRNLVAESTDLIYHLMVLWAAVGIHPDEVWAALAAREGIGGLEEKQSRTV